MKDWVVAGGIVLDGDALLLVQNRRRNGAVEEETGLRVSAWAGPIYEVRAEAPGLGWRLRAEVHVALEYEGDLRVEDPDGIVVDARFVPVAECGVELDGCHPWVREPLAEWLGARWSHLDPPPPYGYRVDGSDIASLVVTRVR